MKNATVSPGKISQRSKWWIFCLSLKLVRISPSLLTDKYFECFPSCTIILVFHFWLTGQRVISTSLPSSGFCCCSFVLLPEWRGKLIQARTALQDVYLPFYVTKSHFPSSSCVSHPLNNPHPLPHSVCRLPRLSSRYRWRLSVSGADGCCRGSWAPTQSTSSPP